MGLGDARGSARGLGWHLVGTGFSCGLCVFWVRPLASALGSLVAPRDRSVPPHLAFPLHSAFGILAAHVSGTQISSATLRFKGVRLSVPRSCLQLPEWTV